MKTSSAKQKGRIHQQYVRDKILEYFPVLTLEDVRSISSGASGEDILMSTKAREVLPVSWECKSHARYAVYKDFEQAQTNCKGYEPILVIKQNRSEPLAIISLDYLLTLLKK